MSFVVGDGEFVALAGPSGRGKTATLKLIAGLLVREGEAVRLEAVGRSLQAGAVNTRRAARARVTSPAPMSVSARILVVTASPRTRLRTDKPMWIGFEDASAPLRRRDWRPSLPD